MLLRLLGDIKECKHSNGTRHDERKLLLVVQPITQMRRLEQARVDLAAIIESLALLLSCLLLSLQLLKVHEHRRERLEQVVVLHDGQEGSLEEQVGREEARESFEIQGDLAPNRMIVGRDRVVGDVEWRLCVHDAERPIGRVVALEHSLVCRRRAPAHRLPVPAKVVLRHQPIVQWLQAPSRQEVATSLDLILEQWCQWQSSVAKTQPVSE